jgi:leucyl-tRNA synthetase
MTIVVQINGKVRSRMEVDASESADNIRKLALDDEKISKYTSGKQIVKEIYVPGKLVNIVIKP